MISIAIRNYLSIRHLSAASLFSRRARAIEDAAMCAGNVDKREHDASVTSAVILSAAFLEATINEFFSDCADGHSTDRTSLLPAKDLMGRLWRLDIPRTASYPILEKYEIALELNGKPPPCKGGRPYQDAKCLVELRNALIHFEPETIVSRAIDEDAEIHKFEKRLRGKFTENPLTGAGNPFYPDKLLGAGCALWAVHSAVAYTDHFFGLLGVVPTYEHVRNEYL